MFDEAMSDRAEAFPLLKLHGTQSPPDVAVQGPEIPADVFGAGGAQEAIQHNRYAFSGLMPVSSMRSPFVAPTSAPRSLLGLLGPPSLWARPLAGFFGCVEVQLQSAQVFAGCGRLPPRGRDAVGTGRRQPAWPWNYEPTALHVRPARWGVVGSGGVGLVARPCPGGRRARASPRPGHGNWSG